MTTRTNEPIDLPRSDDQSDERPADDDGHLPRFQFGLKPLLFGFSTLALLFALLIRMPMVWGAALIWMVLLVAAHVAANAMGTRSAARASNRLHDDGSTRAATLVDWSSAFAPTTRLGGRGRFGSRFQIFLAAGAALGSVVGTALVYRHTGGQMGIGAFTLAACSSAGVGAFLAFLSGSCLKVTTRAWREATEIHSRRRTD